MPAPPSDTAEPPGTHRSAPYRAYACDAVEHSLHPQRRWPPSPDHVVEVAFRDDVSAPVPEYLASTNRYRSVLRASNPDYPPPVKLSRSARDASF
jgi:hypothetical protein